MATAFQVAMTLILLWSGSFESIVVYASVGLSIFSMLAMSSIFVLRWKLPDLPRPFRTPGYPLTPAVYLGLTALLDRRGLLSAAASLSHGPRQHSGRNPFLLLLEKSHSSTAADRAESRERRRNVTPWWQTCWVTNMLQLCYNFE